MDHQETSHHMFSHLYTLQLNIRFLTLYSNLALPQLLITVEFSKTSTFDLGKDLNCFNCCSTMSRQIKWEQGQCWRKIGKIKAKEYETLSYGWPASLKNFRLRALHRFFLARGRLHFRRLPGPVSDPPFSEQRLVIEPRPGVKLVDTILRATDDIFTHYWRRTSLCLLYRPPFFLEEKNMHRNQCS